MKNSRHFLRVCVLFIFAGLGAYSGLQAQTYGPGTGTYLDRYTVNDDNSNHWSVLRLQTSTDRAWNMVNQGTLWWGFEGTTHHGNPGIKRMEVDQSGNFGVVANGTLGDIAGSSKWILSLIHI